MAKYDTNDYTPQSLRPYSTEVGDSLYEIGDEKKEEKTKGVKSNPNFLTPENQEIDRKENIYPIKTESVQMVRPSARLESVELPKSKQGKLPIDQDKLDEALTAYKYRNVSESASDSAIASDKYKSEQERYSTPSYYSFMKEGEQLLSQVGREGMPSDAAKFFESRKPFGLADEIAPNWKAEAYADAMMTNASEDDIDNDLRSAVGKYSANTILSNTDKADIINSFARKDREGRTYYDFGGRRLYGEHLMDGLVSQYIQQHNHPILMRDDKNYRENYAKSKGYEDYESYIQTFCDVKIDPKIEEVKAAYNEWYDANRDTFQHQNAYASSIGDVPIILPHQNIGAEIKELELKAEAFRSPTFWRGLAAGSLEGLRTAAFDISGIGSAMDMKNALDKAYDGQPLNAKENLLVKMYEAQSAIDQANSELRSGDSGARIGEGTAVGIGYALSMMLGNLYTGGGIIKAGVKTTAMQAFKQYAKQSIKAGLKEGLKITGKQMAYGLADDAIRAGVSVHTAKEFAQKRLGQYQFNDGMLTKEESNPAYDMFRAYMTQFVERGSERFGDFINDGVSLFGRGLAQSRFMAGLTGGKNMQWVDRVDDFVIPSVVSQTAKYARIQGIAGEYLSERLNSFITPMMTGEYFLSVKEDGWMPAFNKHYSQLLTSQSAWETFAICGALSSSSYVTGALGGVYNGMQISKLRKQNRELLGSIGNKELKDALSIATATGDYSGLAKLPFKKGDNPNEVGINPEDAKKSMEYVYNEKRIQSIKDEETETARLEAFAPVVMSIVGDAYRGVDMSSPTTTTDIVTATVINDGKEVVVGNVLFGDLENPNATVVVRGANDSVFNLPVNGVRFDRTSMSDALAEQYALMFSTSIAKERLDEVIENMRGVSNMSDEAYEAQLKANGFSVHKAGDSVTLVDGRTATVQGNASNGRYVVETTNEDGAKETSLVGFESILHETNDDMAEAQLASQAEGTIEAPVPLPTDKDGNIAFDEIDNGETLASVLPSQVGGVQNAVEMIDAEVQRLNEQQASAEAIGKHNGISEAIKAQKIAEANAKRIAVLQDARQRLATETTNPTTNESEVEPTAEQKEAERRDREDRMDSMSTYDFSREYRSRMTDSAQSRIILSQFVSNINSALAEMDNAEAEIDKQMSAVEAEISNAYSKATSEADMERIAEQTKDLQQKLDTLKADKIDIDITRRNHQHRKAQYEQTLKDMGVNVKSTIGEDVKLREFVKKASEVLGMPIEINGYAFTSSQQNGVHRIDKDGKSRIYINPNSTSVEQGVGILAHEISHEFKKVLTPEEWAKLENLVMTARFGKDWANSEAYKKEIESIQEAERRSGHAQGVSDEKAREEAVTYALQTFIFDGKRGARAFEAILKQGDISWQDKIMNALREVFDKVKAIFGNEEGVAVREAIEEFGNIFKRYAERAGEIKAEQIEGETAAIINEKDGQSSFSLSTYEDGGRDILQNFLTSQVEGGKLDQKDANAILTEMDAIYDICMDYKDEYAPFGAWSEAAVVRDGEGMPVFSVIKKNDEYKMNLDFSLVCKKRRTLDAVLNEMIGRKLIEIAPDDPTFIAKVNDVVRKYGFETACRLCFVDAKRFRVVNTARNFCKLYNGVVAKLMPTDKKVAINSFDAAGVGYPTHESSLDTLADSELNIKALEDILKRNGEKTVIAKVARHLLEHPEDRKLVHISDFVSTRGFDPTKALNPQILSLYNSKKGSGGPKASFSDVQYLNDVAYANWNVDEAYAVGGVRVQSFSDYVPRMVFDYMQMVAELAAKQMPVHAYTKEAAFAKTFGLTGMKINMSLVPTVVEGGIAAGLDADGNYVWEEGETFDYDTAIEIQNADGYRENCGTIAVGVSDAHIEKMLDDDNIRMVIPYHKSGLNPAVAKHNNIAAFKDYTNQQSTRYANGTKLTKADEKHTPNFYENTRILGDPRKAADAYLAWCKENNYKPKFDKWASHPNYYKLLEDFTTLVDGECFEQRGVTMTFPKEGDAFGSLSNLIAESLEEDAVLEGKRDSLVGAMVDEIESTLFSNREKALETSNSLQKQPNTQEVVTEADVVGDSFSIDRSQYLDEPEIDRAYALRSMDMIDSKVGINKPLAIANIINIVEKLAADDERKMMRGKMSAIDAKYAQEFINTYRAVANYGRAVLAEKFPEYIENSHEDNIKSGKTDLGKIRELFQKYNTDGEMAELFNLVSSAVDKFGTTFRFAALDNTTHGNYVGNAVRYKVGTLNSDIISDQDKAKIILHEMIHAATSSAITLCENAQLRGLLKMSPSVKLRTSVRRLKTLLEDIRSNEEFKGEYGITDVHEMLAELSNPRFVEKLKKHDIWTRIVDGIREIASAIINMVTGKDVAKSDAYTEVRTTLTEIIEETPMEFIEGLNRLRDAGRIKGVKPLVAESAEEIASLAESEGTTSFSLVRDEAKIAELEASPKRIGYRNMVLNEDGTLSAPMAGYIGHPNGGTKSKVKMAQSELGKWEQADEHPELMDERGKVKIYKPEVSDSGIEVNYDPYIHSRLNKINSQFGAAWRRPDLVYVEVEVPATDLESGYQAEGAALPVGAHSWSGGSGIVMLSMYDKPIRVVPWDEVADDWVEKYKDTGVQFNIIPPKLLPVLVERGVKILPPEKKAKQPAMDAYEAFKAEQGASYSLVRPTNDEITFDNFYTNSSAVFEKVSETPSDRPDFVSKSGSKYWYGEDEGGKYVIRQSDHWSANVTTEEAKDAFIAKPDNYRNIASCYWALEGAENQPTTIKLGTINKANVFNVDYNTDTHRLTITLKGGRRVYRDGVSVRDMRKYFNLMKSQGESAALDYVVDMVNEKYAEVVKPADKVQIGKAYLTDFTKWEVELRNNEGITKSDTPGLEQPILDTENPSTANAIAKLNINFETAIEEAIKKTEIKGRLGEHEFLYEIDKALSDNPTIERKGSDYIDIGEGYTLRLADHYANAQNFYKRNDLHDNYGVAIVPPKENTQDKKKGKSRGTFRSHKDVDYKEFVYFPDKMDAEKQIAIFKGLVDFIKTKDFSNLPEPDNTHISTAYSLSRERADIERKAKADGTWLKAPNGKDTNLSPKQWVTVRTKAFKEWFGDWENDPENASKIVDENGEPKVVYHQTNATTFVNEEGKEFGELGWRERREWEDREDFEDYWEETDFYKFSRMNARTTMDFDGFFFAPEFDEDYGYGERTIEAFLNIRKPASYGDYTFDYSQNDAGQKERIRLQEEGYDGVINAYDGVIDEYIAFEPNQIKSATENIGTFDSANDDIRYSLNRDVVTIATPELETEANETLAKEPTLVEQLDEAQTALDRLRSKINKRNERKELTFDEVRKFLLDGDTLQGLQEASAGQYKRIITNVLNTLEKMPEKRIAVDKLVDKMQEALTSARLNVANSNLKAASKDFANVIKKKREGKNSRGEVVAKSVDNTTRKIMQEFESTIEPLFTYDGKVDWKKVLDVGEKISDFLDTKIAELEDAYSQNGDASTLGLLNLLEAFKVVRDRANDVQAILKDQKDIKSERNSIEETLSTLEELLNTYYAGGRDFGKAKRELEALGYTIAQAEKAVDKLKRDHRATAIDMRSAKLEECNAKSSLIDAVRDMNTAIQSLDKEGRVALKEEVAKRKEEKRVFRNGVLRSIRNPLFRNTIDYNAKDRELKTASGDAYNWWKKYLLNRGGDAIVSEGVDTFEYRCRRMDVMSVPNAWLHDGLYYQFMLHPEKGFLARSDWRYHTERYLRARLDEGVKQFTGFDSVDKLKGTLNSESPFTFEVFRTDKDGKVLSDVTVRTLTINEVLYIRSAVRQDGAIRGYLAIGLTEDHISDIVDWVENVHSSLCDLCDWVQSEGGIMEEMYAMRNADYRRINGVDLPHTEWYFPLKRVADVLPSQETVGDAIPTSALANGIGSNKARTRNVVPMDLNAGFFSVLDSHIAESVQWTAYADLFDKMNTLLGSPMFKKMLKVQGVTLSKFKDSFLRAAGERLGQGESNFVAKTISSFTKNAVASNVVSNLNTALKQLASITAGLSRDINPKLWGLFVKNFPIVTNLSTAVEKGWRRYKGDNIYKEMDVVRSNFTWAMQNVPTFAERVDTENMGMDIFKQDGFQRWDEVSGWFKKKGMAPNRFMDIVVSAAVAKTVYEFEYEKKRKRGLSHEEAHNDARMEAALVVNQTQQSDQGAFLSSWQADKKDTVGKVLSTGFTAYNNSQLAFDRNARAAFLQLMGLSFDGGNKDRVRYLTEEYERRGLDYQTAKKLAKKDLREAFLTQFNTFVHNTFINPVIWTLMPSVSLLGTAFVQYLAQGDDDEEERRGYWEIVEDDLQKVARWSNLVYLLPGSTMPVVKTVFDMFAENGFDFTKWGKTLRTSRDAVVFQPLIDLAEDVIKYLKDRSKEKEVFGNDVDTKVSALGLVIAAADTLTRYGLGVSASNVTRFVGGLWGAVKNREIEDFMNITTQPKALTKLMASRIRKGESMKDYIARVAGVYKIIYSFTKGADTRELRKQYIDKMDAIIIRENGNPFDYEAYKENKKIVADIAKVLPLSADGKPREDKEFLYDNKILTKKEKDLIVELTNMLPNIRLIKSSLDTPQNLNWDTYDRLPLMQELNGDLDQFLDIWESNPELRNKLNIRDE